jgi:hypothetical protein
MKKLLVGTAFTDDTKKEQLLPALWLPLDISAHLKTLE